MAQIAESKIQRRKFQTMCPKNGPAGTCSPLLLKWKYQLDPNRNVKLKWIENVEKNVIWFQQGNA